MYRVQQGVQPTGEENEHSQARGERPFPSKRKANNPLGRKAEQTARDESEIYRFDWKSHI